MRDLAVSRHQLSVTAKEPGMISPNLVVVFTLSGDSRVHIKGAARIKFDGRGGLTLYDAENGQEECVNLGCLESLTIRGLSGWNSRPLGMVH